MLRIQVAGTRGKKSREAQTIVVAEREKIVILCFYNNNMFLSFYPLSSEEQLTRHRGPSDLLSFTFCSRTCQNLSISEIVFQVYTHLTNTANSKYLWFHFYKKQTFTSCTNKDSYRSRLEGRIWPPGMQRRVGVRQEQQNILIWSWGVLILRRRNVTAVPAAVFRTFTQQWGNLKHWEAHKYLRLYSDTLLFHFQSSSIPSFQLTGEEEESTAAFLCAWAVSGDGARQGHQYLHYCCRCRCCLD